jgi:simple sugar transport system substrate-binding protein
MERYLMGAQAMAAELGVQLTAFNANGDPAAMAALVEEAVQNGVDAIVINHGQTDVLQPAVEAALEQGVKVVTFDLVIDHPDVPEIEQDNMLIGFKLAKKLVADCAGRANVIYVNAEGFAPLEKRDRAWQDFKWRYPALKELAHIGTVTQQTAADTRDQLQTLLQEQPDTTAVLAMWDEFAKGAMQAITQSDLSPQVRLYSVDITDEDIQLMTELGSPWVATVATDAYNIGRLALRTAIALIAGEKVDKYLLVEPQLIPQEFLVDNRISNMDELIQVLPTLGESRLVWFDWMEPLLARKGYHIPAATLPPEQLVRQLQTTLTTLQWRNVELQTAAEVSRAASSILDPDKLLQEVADLTKERFGLYHAHIYRLDETRETLQLVAGAGDVGRQMVVEGWSIPLEREQSLVARAARTRQGVIVNDVQTVAGYLPNPLLPDTRSEMAVPMIVGGQVLGALDVQADVVDRFTEGDVRIQTMLAAQVAVALQNARSYEQTRQTSLLLEERVKELDCLNEVGREIEGMPPIPELLQWVTERVPTAMRHTDKSLVAVEFGGQIYGNPETLELSDQISQALYVRGESVGRMYIAYTEKHDFSTEERALLGGVAARLSGYIENRRLFEQTQQRTAEFEETTSFLDSILENIPTMLFVKEAKDLRFVRWNKAAEQLCGFTREDVIGKNDYDLFPKEEADFFTARDRDVLTSGELVDIPEEPIDTLHQGTRLLHTRKIPIYGPDGQPRYLLGISEDITERKEAEAERERLLNEVEAAYLQYIRQEWEQFLREERKDIWHIEHQQAGLQTDSLTTDLTKICDEVLRSGEIKIVPGVRSNGQGSEPTVVAPIILRGQAIGTFSLQDIDPDREWNEEEIALIEAVSEQLAQTIENLRLFENTQQRAAREKLIADVTGQVWASADLEEVIHTAVEKLGLTLDASKVVVRLGVEEQLISEVEHGETKSQQEKYE